MTLLETRIDIFTDVIEHEHDVDFLEINSGPKKLYPGEPTCLFKDEKVQCLVGRKTKESINRAILTEIIKTLDNLYIYGVVHTIGKKLIVMS